MTGGPAIEVYRAGSEDFAIVENLLEFYTYEFSESAQIDVGPDGRFGYEDLADYWNRTESVEFEVDIGSEVTYYALPDDLSKRLREKASNQGVSPQELLNLWVNEKLQEN